MKVIILGSGTCVPSLTRNAPGYYLETDDTRILVDCGTGTMLQLAKAGKSYLDIDAVFLTHGHPDHCADLMPLVQALLYTPGFKRDRPLEIIAHDIFLHYYRSSLAPMLGKSAVIVRTISAASAINYRDLTVYTANTPHSSESIAYRFENNDTSVVFTGDTDFDDTLADFSRNSELLITDCSFPDSEKIEGHMCASECGRLAAGANAVRLVLSHIYPSKIDDQERVAQSQKHFKGRIILAEDLMELQT
ncbi:MAG: MBL fold metallo-hydrolase [Nitrospira sp.]|nr:MBL fold metallo-hydrolase [bacterium]MBL7049285.1 MBL fold metallo-hydrolase [Nitrospira sp.]